MKQTINGGHTLIHKDSVAVLYCNTVSTVFDPAQDSDQRRALLKRVMDNPEFHKTLGNS
jgi:hypothetical protein